jgi:formamidopyrimidine-DNA glycosylase
MGSRSVAPARGPGTVRGVPELPEVETVRRELEPLLVGRRVVEADAHPSAKFAPAVAVIGATFRSVGRRGKYLVMGLDDGRRLVAHLGMTGRFQVSTTEETSPYVRAWWRLDDGRTVWFVDVRRFGRIAVVGDGPSGLATFDAMGPEPFTDEFSPQQLLSATRRSTIRIKTQLLSQRPVAGVGNIYADEALWRARIHPGARRISGPAAVRLHEAIVEVLAEGIEHGGTTLRDYRRVDGGTGANQHRLECYGRAGEPCPRCATTLRRSVVDGRGTTHCPTCQRR